MGIKKTVQKRFCLKYATLVFMILTSILFIFFYIVADFYPGRKNYIVILTFVMFGGLIASIVLLIVYLRKYERNLLIEKLGKNHKEEDVREFINEYLQIFVENKMGYIRYSEYIFWFSREIRFIYLQKDFYDERIPSLYYGLRYNGRGVNIASTHKDSFINLCKTILDSHEKTDIYNMFCSMEKEKKQLGKWIVIAPNKSILVYCTIMVTHSIGCVLISESGWDFIGNLCLSLPTDVLLILIYLGYVQDRELKEEIEKDKEKDKERE